MAAIAFGIDELASELDCIREVASKRFLTPEAYVRVGNAVTQIRYAKPSNDLRWEVSLEQPIATTMSTGDYQADGQGALNLSARISWCWQLRCARKGEVDVTGLASTRIGFVCHDGDQTTQVVAFCFDIGVAGGPGPALHAQIKSVGASPMHFAGSELDVPRIGTFVPTPAEALEFALSELFQEGWRQELGRDRTNYVEVWRNQRSRMARLLTAAADHLKHAPGETALTTMKFWMPAGASFACVPDHCPAVAPSG